MNKGVSLNQNNVRIGYYRYRAYITPVIILVVCAILFFQVIIPQFQIWLDLQGQIAASRAKVSALQQSVSTLTQTNDTDLDTKLQIVARAMPIDQDLLSILSAINHAGISSGVSINDYSIQSQVIDAAGIDQQVVPFTVVVSGSLDNLKQFISDIKSELPLSDISEIKTTNNQSTVTVVFYFKKMPKLTVDNAEKLQGLTAQEEGLIKTLALFDKTKQSTSDNISFPNTDQ